LVQLVQNSYCQTAAGEWQAYFQIAIDATFWKQQLLNEPLGGNPSGCSAAKVKQEAAKAKKQNIANTKINK
jgi:hypothetical protein